MKINALKIKNFKLLTFFLLFASLATSQTIINAERVGSERDSSVYSLNLMYSGTRGNVTTDQISLSPVVVLKRKKNELKVFASYNVLSQSGNKILNSGYAHARHNYNIKSNLKSVVFYQLQFNEVLRLNKREVIGAGFRFNVVNKDSVSAGLSVGVMHEYELLNRSGLQLNEVYKTSYLRGSLVGSFSWIINNYLKINDVLYYQPYLKNIKDYRILNDVNFSVKINDYFSLLLVSSIRLDSKPPSSIGGYDWSFKVGVSVTR